MNLSERAPILPPYLPPSKLAKVKNGSLGSGHIAGKNFRSAGACQVNQHTAIPWHYVPSAFPRHSWFNQDNYL